MTYQRTMLEVTWSYPGGKKRLPNDKLNTRRTCVSESNRPSQPPNPHGNQTDPSPVTLGANVQSSIPQSFSLISVDGKNSWILDSCATYHSTGFSEHFVSCIPCASNETIRIANDFLASHCWKMEDFSLCRALLT